jgi:hypothetical protein
MYSTCTLPGSRSHAVLPAMPSEALYAMLQMLAPDEPLPPPKDVIVTSLGAPTVSASWPKDVLDKREKFPGYQPIFEYVYHRKGGYPAVDAPLRPWLTAVVDDAKSAWSLAIDLEETELQFVDWLRCYLKTGDLVRDQYGKLDDAANWLRERFGIPPFPVEDAAS